MAVAQCCECKTSSIVGGFPKNALTASFAATEDFIKWVASCGGEQASLLSQKPPLVVCLETRLPFLGREESFGPMR